MIGEQVLPAHRTTPESYELQELLRTMSDAGCTHVVMEASSHALVQHRTAGLEFDAGVFTNLTQDHLDYHKTMEAYREAKERLFDQSEIAVFNLDDEAGRWYRTQVDCPVFTYSENKDGADLSAKNIRLFPGHVEFEALTLGRLSRVHLPIPGGFTIYNALAALAAGLCALYLRLRFPELIFHWADMVMDRPLLRRTARFSFVTALHMCNLYIGKLLVQGTVNALGAYAINAFTAATRVEGFANSFGDSGAAAVAVFVGQNTGAGEYGRVRQGFRQGQKLLLAFGAFMSLVMVLGAEPCLRLVLPAGSRGPQAECGRRRYR